MIYIDYEAECRINYCWTKLCLFVTSLVKTIEVDSRVPGIRDEIPFPQVKLISQLSDQFSVQSEITALAVETYRRRKNLSSHYPETFHIDRKSETAISYNCMYLIFP